MLLLLFTLDSCRLLVLHFTLDLLSHRLFIVLHTGIALQTSAGLDALLDFGLSIPINAASLPSIICAPTTSSICKTQLF